MLHRTTNFVWLRILFLFFASIIRFIFRMNTHQLDYCRWNKKKNNDKIGTVVAKLSDSKITFD